MGTKRVVQHHTDQQAQLIFSEMVLPWAQPNGHKDGDYAIDYTVELFNRMANGIEQAAGYDFQVQLKGTEHPTGDSDHVSFSLSVNDLAHYLDNKRVPVFLVVVDVSSRQGWWLFLQRFAAECLPEGWREQETVTVKIPRSQSLSPEGGFREGVVKAAAWMSNRWPGTPQAAIAAESARLEAIDPRLKLEVSAEPGVTKVTVFPKQDIMVRVVVGGSPAAQKAFESEVGFSGFIDPMAMGVELKLQGFPISEGEKLTGFKLGSDLDVVVSVLRDRDGSVAALELPGKFSAGPHGTRGTVIVGQGLVSLNLVVDFRKDNGRQLETSWTFCSEEWHGKDAMGPLNEFERLDRVFGGVRDSDRFSVEISVGGNRFIAAYMPQDFMVKIRKGAGFIEVVRRIRQLFKPPRRAIPVPSSMSAEEVLNLDRIWSLRSGRSVRLQVNEMKSTLELPSERAADLVRFHNMRSDLRILREHFELPLWGEVFDVGPVELDFESTLFRIESVFGIDEGPMISAVVSIAEPSVMTVHPVANGSEAPRA